MKEKSDKNIRKAPPATSVTGGVLIWERFSDCFRVKWRPVRVKKTRLLVDVPIPDEEDPIVPAEYHVAKADDASGQCNNN
jgi:hypothetical protein